MAWETNKFGLLLSQIPLIGKCKTFPSEIKCLSSFKQKMLNTTMPISLCIFRFSDFCVSYSFISIGFQEHVEKNYLKIECWGVIWRTFYPHEPKVLKDLGQTSGPLKLKNLDKQILHNVNAGILLISRS